MLVVCDTSPIRALQVLGLIEAIPRIFSDVLVPPRVAGELLVVVPGLGAVDVRAYGFFRVLPPAGPFPEATKNLGEGEAEALTLAVERRADLVFVDDADARAVAKILGLAPIGVLGALVRLKDVGVIDRVAPLIDHLVSKSGFRLSAQVRREVLNLARE